MENIGGIHSTEMVTTCGVEKHFDVKSARYYYCHENGTTTWDAPARVNIPLARSLPGEDEGEEMSRQHMAKEAARQER